MMTGLLAIVIAYLLGAIPFGYLLVRFSTGKDVRSAGSGNIGATNVLRTTGRTLGIATLVLDIAKGVLAVWIAAELTGNEDVWMSASALAVMAGHSYPVFLHFKGGKAVATFVGAFAFLTPVPLLATAVVFFAVVAGTGYISAASVVGAAVFPLGVWLILHPSPEVLIASLIAGAFIIYRHKENLERIHAGMESSFSLSKK
jgi:glycerol-3-phosphate acyltransferase PlsY